MEYVVPHVVLILPLALQRGVVRVLIAERTPDTGGGCFPVSGPVESCETLESVARRVLAHEAGVIADGVMHAVDGYAHRLPIPPGELGRHPPGTRTIDEYAFWTRLPRPAPPIMNPRRYVRAEWLPVDRALGRLSLAMHARALRLAAAAAFMLWGFRRIPTPANSPPSRVAGRERSQ